MAMASTASVAGSPPTASFVSSRDPLRQITSGRLLGARYLVERCAIRKFLYTEY